MESYSDITEFLPKYPNINQESQDIFNPYDDNFYKNIYKKKEFYDNRLNAIEEFPQKPGQLMKHQKIIANFFSSHTIYNELLLFHSMGTGKSCSTIGAVEAIKEAGGFRGALYLVKGEALINNFINELVFNCTDGRYIPEDYEKLTVMEKLRRKKKAISEYYNFGTFETFAKKIKETSIKNIKDKYDNYIIIIDEVHNLRMKSKTIGLNIYNEFHTFLHNVTNCKILLLSGTPMFDQPNEISSVMNLILPLDKQMLTGEDFNREFLVEVKKNVYNIRPSHIQYLKQIFKGRVSYLQAMKSQVIENFMGNHIGNLEYFKVIPNYMSEFQSTSYMEAFQKDITIVKEGIYSNSRQASLFVFPDGSYGVTGFTKYITKTVKKIGIDKKKNTIVSYSLNKELRQALAGDSVEAKLEKLQKFSSLYAESIRTILNSHRDGKCVFVYNELVEGSGLIIFGLLLEFFGFYRAKGNESIEDYKPRYISLTYEMATTNQLKNLINRFNQPDNMRGQVINVIMGSKKIAEGFSFKNIQVEDIHTGWYNYSKISQIIARGNRVGSHRLLFESGAINVTIDIYQRISIPNNKKLTESIDLIMYEIAEKKDISIKSIERIIKESAFDCALNYKRNSTARIDGQRDCEYMNCYYECDDIDQSLIDNVDIIPYEDLTGTPLDFSTYQLYYSGNSITNIINKILKLFRTVFILDIETIKTYFDNYTDFEILSALRKIINENIVILNKYNFNSYLKENNNIYFLVNSLSIKGLFSSEYYTKYPTIANNIKFADVLEPLYLENLPKIIEQICSTKEKEYILEKIEKLPIQVKQIFLETSLLARKLNLLVNINVRDIILNMYKEYYVEMDDTIISLLDDNNIRCLTNLKWEECNQKIKDKLSELIQKQKQDLLNNKYGYYGQYNPENKRFCIRNVSEEKPDKKNVWTSGKVCDTYHLNALYPLVIDILEMPLPDENTFNDYLLDLVRKKKKTKFPKDLNNKQQLYEILTKIKEVNQIYNDPDKLSIEKIKRIIYWGSMSKNTLCPHIQDFFQKEGLLIQDIGCGKSGKIKI
jgi:hypothetical protein